MIATYIKKYLNFKNGYAHKKNVFYGFYSR